MPAGLIARPDLHIAQAGFRAPFRFLLLIAFESAIRKHKKFGQVFLTTD